MVCAVVQAGINRAVVWLERIGTQVPPTWRGCPPDLRNEIFGVHAITFPEMPCNHQLRSALKRDERQYSDYLGNPSTTQTLLAD